MEMKDAETNDLFIHCANCGSHLGNSFDGQIPWGRYNGKTGKVYVVNSASMKFVKPRFKLFGRNTD